MSQSAKYWHATKEEKSKESFILIDESLANRVEDVIPPRKSRFSSLGYLQ